MYLDIPIWIVPQVLTRRREKRSELEKEGIRIRGGEQKSRGKRNPTLCALRRRKSPQAKQCRQLLEVGRDRK